MLGQLELKKREEMKLRTVCSRMENFKETNFDFALCVFTVLLYLLDEESLKKALSVAYHALKPEGLLLIDIPSRILFQNYSRGDEVIERSVSVLEENGDIYRYKEEIRVRGTGDEESNYSDEFRIRYWPSEYVSNILTTTGFVLEADLTACFSATGSYYWIMKKADNGAAMDENFVALHRGR